MRRADRQAVRVQILTPGPEVGVVSADLVVTGSAASDVALVSLTLGGVEVTRDALNYARWKVTLPLTVLQSLRGSAADGRMAHLELAARDACRRRYSDLGSIDLDVLPPDNLPIPDLQLAIDLQPNLVDANGQAREECYLGTDGRSWADLTLTSVLAAPGAPVVVKAAPTGTVAGGDGAGKFRLEAADGGAPTATGRLWPAGEGTVHLEASGLAVSHPPKLIVVAGPPRLSPAEVTLSPGATQVIEVETRGHLSSCRALAVGAIAATVTVQGNTLLLDGTEVDLTGTSTTCDQPERWQGVVTPSATTAEGVLVLTCTDTRGQSGSATITISVP